jgi:hypothetical protein
MKPESHIILAGSATRIAQHVKTILRYGNLSLDQIALLQGIVDEAAHVLKTSKADRETT